MLSRAKSVLLLLGTEFSHMQTGGADPNVQWTLQCVNNHRSIRETGMRFSRTTDHSQKTAELSEQSGPRRCGITSSLNVDYGRDHTEALRALQQ